MLLSLLLLSAFCGVKRELKESKAKQSKAKQSKSFPAKAGPTKNTSRPPVGLALAGRLLICAALLIFIHKRLKHRKTRLGCRLNAGLAQWAEPHGCGESAVRTGMSVRRGPTEQDRSEGTPRHEGPNQEQSVFGYFWGALAKSDPP